MARKGQKPKDKAACGKDKGTYGSKLSAPKTRSKSNGSSPAKVKRSSKLDRADERAAKKDSGSKKRKAEAAAKKSKSKPEKPKAKAKHHVAKFTKNSIKQRVNAAAEKSNHHGDRFGKSSLNDRTKRKKRNGKQSKRIEFQLNIPDNNHDYFLRPKNVPWYKAENQERFRENVTVVKVPNRKVSTSTLHSNGKDDEETLQLPSDAVLSHIDAEIQSFAAYVKLTPSERRARDAFLSHITEILTTQFANGGRGGYRRKSNDEENIYVEPFGSYATQEVCTFASDVDMCLWGLVQEDKPNSHLKFVSSDSNEADDVEDTILNTNQGGECPLLTESSLLRTMDAIQSAQSKANDLSDIVKKSAAKEKVKSETEIAKAADDCLFVIDREGVDMGDGEEKEPSADSGAQSVDAETEQSKSDAEQQCDDNKASSTEQAKMKQKNKNAPKEQFEFAIDVDGVHELGGDVADLPGFTESSSVASDKEKTTEGNTKDKSLETAEDLNQKKSDVNDSAATPTGKSHDKAINLDDDSSEDEVIVLDDDSIDEADKLDTFYSRQSKNGSNQASILSTSRIVESANFSASAKSDYRDNDVISVGDSDSSDDDNVPNQRGDEVLELSVTSSSVGNSSNSSKPIVKPVFGPTGKTRVRVISVLQGLTSHLRRSSFTNTVECRSRARVPIVNCNTRTGFEGDIAIGGHNGVDTSTYAKRQVNRFQSFASIVLVLKVLMVQQGLDKPFTGGLGSYKLYVLVAHHIEHHLANGGNDRPSEILISLLFRYSCIGSINNKSTTDLESIRNAEGLIASDDGVCDLSPVFRIPDVVEMFRECHERLFDRMLLAEGFDDEVCNNLSYLSSMIDCFRLKEARESSDRRSRIADDITRPIGRDHPGKIGHGPRKIGKVFSKNEYGSGAPKRPMPTSFLDSGSNKRRQSYSDSQPKRGPRGGLIPAHRPDVAAMKSIRSNPEKELLMRGTKNRKNKKKQMRDDALRVFSRRSI